MARGGFISLHRQIRENFLWTKPRKFCEIEAWLYMLMEAYHADGQRKIGDIWVSVPRGSFVTSKCQMMTKWHWGKGKCLKFLDLLQAEKMLTIGPIKNTKFSLVTILKYNNFQDSSELRKRKNGRDSIKQERKDKKSKSDAKASQEKDTPPQEPFLPSRSSHPRALGDVLAEAFPRCAAGA